MNDNGEQVPVEVTEWLGRLSFNELGASQKALVLSSLTEQEYAELHEAALHAARYSTLEKAATQSKAMLLARFDEHHRKQTNVRLLLKPVALWKAAAVFAVLLMAVVASGYMVRNSLPEKIVTRYDTVFVNVPIASQPLIVHDTVVIERQSTANARKTDGEKRRPAGNMRKRDQELNVVRASEIGSEANALKGNSLRDDSLALNYQFMPL